MDKNDKIRNKYLLKNTAIFAIGNFASKFISFFLVPIYTNTMIAAEYGVADLLYTLCNFLIPLFTLNITEAILRFSLDKNSSQQKILRIATTMIIPLIVIGSISIPVLNTIEGYGDYSLYFYAYMVTTAISQIYLVAIKGQEKLKHYSFGNFLHTVLITSFNLLFLLVLNMGIKGYFLAYIISNIIISIYSITICKLFRHLKSTPFDKTLFKRMVKYSALLIPTTFMWWIMNFLDRVMVTSIIGAAENGIYAVSYKIPTILSSISAIFMQAWLFSAIKEKDTKDNIKYTNKVFKALTVILTITSIVLLIFIRQIYKFYVAPGYYDAWKYVPSLMIGHVFLTLSTFISTSYNVHKDSKGHLRSASIGAIINLVLNSILIPTINVQGAAIATTISYISVFIYRLFDTKKYLQIKLDYKFTISVLLILLVSVSLFINETIAIAIQALSIILFITIYFSYVKNLLKTINDKLHIRNRS